MCISMYFELFYYCFYSFFSNDLLKGLWSYDFSLGVYFRNEIVERHLFFFILFVNPECHSSLWVYTFCFIISFPEFLHARSVRVLSFVHCPLFPAFNVGFSLKSCYARSLFWKRSMFLDVFRCNFHFWRSFSCLRWTRVIVVYYFFYLFLLYYVTS